MSSFSTPNQEAIKRFFNQRPAVIGLFWIVFCVLVAILGYAIAPDSSPNANEQSPTIALQSPFFQATVLVIPKSRTIATTTFFEKMLFGAENDSEQIPINDYRIEGDSIRVTLFAGNQQSYHLREVDEQIYNEKQNIIEKNNDNTFLNQKLQKKHLYTKTYWLGTDNFGRDILSRLILGLRVSLGVGLLAVLISLFIGVSLGSAAAYFGGRVDSFIMLLINTLWSIPTILLVFAIVLAFGRGVGVIFLAVGLTMWTDVARLVRGQVLSLKEQLFVTAAESMGFSSFRILSKHILPNILGSVMVVAASNFATAILIESGLSYLGFGIQPPTPSWGTMLNENYGYAIGGKPFVALVPSLAILLMVLAFNLVGNGVRDALDVKE